MVKLRVEVGESIIDFCKSPVPRTASQIVNWLKSTFPSFYPKSRTDLVVKFLHLYWLNELVKECKIMKFTPLDKEDWNKARGLMSHFSKQQQVKRPRKLSALYQTNFFLAGKNEFSLKPPALKELNLDMFALLSRFRLSHLENFQLNLLNLLSCHAASAGAERDMVRLAVYASDAGFTQEERDLLERFLELSGDERVKPLLNSIPFRPDPQKAVAFLKLFGVIGANEKEKQE